MILLVIFIFFAPIVVLNLINVSDITKIRTESELIIIGKKITPCRAIFLPSKLYRMRLVRYGEAWRATAICLENSPSTGKHFPDDNQLTMEHLWTPARDTVGVEFLAEITSVNGVEFNAVAFVAGK
ncbi:conserved hypothetical protein [Culex quinquefasciatus]|uniref:Uncharacterized protein n=1 Tax=Culex quinquefasciatus TaxID=7176 RepID=B0W7F8_CULQU|nr:conserved hypothetical protein [Culex quinquefasciatus]|eukprot:XP_001844642.1 conserved hypothetical protein [Culex quinquefasciatus]